MLVAHSHNLITEMEKKLSYSVKNGLDSKCNFTNHFQWKRTDTLFRYRDPKLFYAFSLVMMMTAVAVGLYSLPDIPLPPNLI